MVIPTPAALHYRAAAIITLNPYYYLPVKYGHLASANGEDVVEEVVGSKGGVMLGV